MVPRTDRTVQLAVAALVCLAIGFVLTIQVVRAPKSDDE
jgi:hypothetical protein